MIHLAVIHFHGFLTGLRHGHLHARTFFTFGHRPLAHLRMIHGSVIHRRLVAGGRLAGAVRNGMAHVPMALRFLRTPIRSVMVRARLSAGLGSAGVMPGVLCQSRCRQHRSGSERGKQACYKSLHASLPSGLATVTI